MSFLHLPSGLGCATQSHWEKRMWGGPFQSSLGKWPVVVKAPLRECLPMWQWPAAISTLFAPHSSTVKFEVGTNWMPIWSQLVIVEVEFCESLPQQLPAQLGYSLGCQLSWVPLSRLAPAGHSRSESEGDPLLLLGIDCFSLRSSLLCFLHFLVVLLLE